MFCFLQFHTILVGMYKSKGPVELIYTRPPNSHSAAAYIGPPKSNGNVWLPNWSQLYAQSYDPRYYNYIARTGKIKPWLYGKMEDPAKSSQTDNSMWMDLLRGFTKHGLKNIMTPGFLIGMSIPAITLMLTALVQQRGLARSSDSAWNFSLRENDLQEYTDKLRRAIKCYEENHHTIKDC